MILCNLGTPWLSIGRHYLLIVSWHIGQYSDNNIIIHQPTIGRHVGGYVGCINRLSLGQHVSLYANNVLAKMLTKSWLLVLVSMLADNWLTYWSIGHRPSAVPPTAHKNIWTKFRPTYQPSIDGVLVNIPAKISTDTQPILMTANASSTCHIGQYTQPHINRHSTTCRRSLVDKPVDLSTNALPRGA